MSLLKERAAMVGGEPNNQQLTITKEKDIVDYFMSVHIYKYGLKRIYFRNVSSSINVRFCAYCAHFPGIDREEADPKVLGNFSRR